MRRPAVFFAGSIGIGVVLAFMLEIDNLIWLIAFTGAGAYSIYTLLLDRHGIKNVAALLVCFISLGGIWFESAEIQIDPLEDRVGQIVSVTGIVTEAEFDEQSCDLVVKMNDSSKSIVKYYGDCTHLTGCSGKSVQIRGSVELPQERRNPGCFDYRLYLKSRGIGTIIKADSVAVIDGEERVYLQWVAKIRDAFRNRISEYMDDYKCGLVMAIMFGDKTMLDENLYEDFQKNGTAHVLAVSGLHTGIIYAFFVLIWKGKKGAFFYLVTLVLLFLYMSLADFSPSVVRATCMILLHSISGLIKCRYDLLTAASVTFILMIMGNPYQIFHIGFQLSFLAIISLAVIIPFVQRFYQGVFLSAIAIQAGMVPYTAFAFNYISIGSIMANIPIIFIAGILLPAGLCSLFCMMIPGELFGFIVTIMDLCCDIMIWINELFYASGKTSFDVISPPVWVLIIYYGIVFFLVSESGQLLIIRQKVKVVLTVVLLIVITAAGCNVVTESGFSDADIVFVDVGQGDCIHIRTPSGKNYLIDGGGSTDYDTGMKVLKPYLLKNGVRKIDVAFVTHLHEDHYGGIRSLAADGMIETVAVYEANRQIEEKLKKETSAEIIYVHSGYRLSMDEDVFIDILYPAAESEESYKEMLRDEEDENKTSLIMKVNYQGVTVLVTGDIDNEGEELLTEKCGDLLACDIMKVPHHGSKYSSSEEFLDTAKPGLAVFQVGRNNYGHPSEEAVNRYLKIGCEVARNDKEGAIGIIINENEKPEVVKMIH